MNIEKEVFKKVIINTEKLIKYGFVEQKKQYIYKTLLQNKSFQVKITIDKNLNVIGKIIDLRVNEEYLAYRIKEQIGEFSTKIKEEYLNILEDICLNCCEREYFYSNIANDVAKYIFKIYQVKPEFLWEDTPDCGVFRNKKNNKWFGIIMNIDYSKIDSIKKGQVEVINLKLDNIVEEVLNNKGIYKAYHMNKKYWVSIVLDGTININEISKLIDISYTNSLHK